METPLKDSPNIDTDFWEQIKSDIMEINGKQPTKEKKQDAINTLEKTGERAAEVMPNNGKSRNALKKGVRVRRQLVR